MSDGTPDAGARRPRPSGPPDPPPSRIRPSFLRLLLPPVLLLALSLPLLRLDLPADAVAEGGAGGLPVAPLGPLLAETTRFTSGFGEPRSQRLHAGVDYSTNRETGMAVLAPAGGWISRIAADYGGYGLQLMLTDSLGRRHLFAHLISFRQDLQREWERARDESGEYSQALFPEPGRFPVRAGEVIALSGDTGNGPPHLHYELRGLEEDRVYNPLRHGLAVFDDQPPQVEGLALVPLAAGTRVEGSLFPLRRAPLSVAPGRWTLRDTLTCHGPVGLAVHAVDRLPGNEARLMPWQVELVEDGRTLFQLRLDSFPLDRQGQNGRLFHRWLQGETGKPWLRLWGEGGALGLWSDANRPNPLEPVAERPVRRLELRVSDAAGNLALLDLVLRCLPLDDSPELFTRPDSAALAELKPPPPAKAKPSKGRKKGRRARTPAPGPLPEPEWSLLDTGDGLHLRLSPLPPAAARVDAPVLRGPRGVVPAWGQLRARGWEWVLPRERVPDGRLIVEGLSGLTELDLSGAWLDPRREHVLRDSAEPPAVVVYTPHRVVEAPTRLLLRRGPRSSFELGPEALQLERPVEVDISLEHMSEKERDQVALFQANSRGAPIALVGGVVEEDRLKVSVARGGRYVLHADRKGPSITYRKPPRARTAKARKLAAKGLPPRPALRWEIGGDPSGIALVELWIDGNRHFPRYEPESHQATFQPTEPWPAGEHEVELVVRDRSGNVSHLREKLRIRPESGTN